MGWYADLDEKQANLARMNPAGLAVIHTAPFAQDSGQRWVLYPYLRYVSEKFQPVLEHGGKAMLSMPPRHGKSLYCSVFTAAWYAMTVRVNCSGRCASHGWAGSGGSARR